MNIPYVMRKCTVCGRWLVANKVNFYGAKKGKYGLESKCKECIRNKNRQYNEANKDKIAEHHKQYYEANKDKIVEYRKANKDKKAEYMKQRYQNKRDKILEYQNQWNKDNKDKIQQWYQDNRGKMLEYKKQYYQDNKDKMLEYGKQYRQTPQGQVSEFNKHNRRRIKEEQQGTGITKDQWLECMSFFDWRCAYSGEKLKKDTRTLDHIVPLKQGGEHEIWNLVPMTRSLNSSKCANDMLEWYKEQDFYSEARLAKIYEWQEYARKKWKIS